MGRFLPAFEDEYTFLIIFLVGFERRVSSVYDKGITCSESVKTSIQHNFDTHINHSRMFVGIFLKDSILSVYTFLEHAPEIQRRDVCHSFVSIYLIFFYKHFPLVIRGDTEGIGGGGGKGLCIYVFSGDLPPKPSCPDPVSDPKTHFLYHVSKQTTEIDTLF